MTKYFCDICGKEIELPNGIIDLPYRYFDGRCLGKLMVHDECWRDQCNRNAEKGGYVMDAVKFVKEYLRMCATVSDCKECPAFMTDFCTVNVEEQSQETAGEVVRIVEEWSAAHPCKTRQSVFLEQWPNARPADDGVLTFCPKRFDFHISCLAECHSLKKCSDCRREFWMQEVK